MNGSKTPGAARRSGGACPENPVRVRLRRTRRAPARRALALSACGAEKGAAGRRESRSGSSAR